MKSGRLLLTSLTTGALALVGGCAGSKPLPPTFEVPPGRYDAAFDASREVLREARFPIDRVDAGAGVISTDPKTSAGLATPWDDEQSSTRDEFEDLFNHQRRLVRITFEPAQPPPNLPGTETQLGETADVPNLRRCEGPLIARVMVVIEREHRPGRRVETVSIASSTFTRDPALGPRGLGGPYWVPIAQDPALAGRLAAKIQKALAKGAAAPPPAADEPPEIGAR